MNPDVLKELVALHSLGYGLGRIGALTEVLQTAADAVAGLLPADRVSIIEIDRERQRVGHFVRGGPGSAQVVTSVEFDELNGGLTGWVLDHGKPALSRRDASDERESPEARERRRATGCGAIIVVPLVFDGVTEGTMTAINRLDERDFTEDDVDVMVLFASYCSVVIGNARLILELRHAKGIVDVANQALRREVESKNKLFTILAHDLRGPIGNLCILLGLISQSRRGDEFDEILDEGEKSAQRTYDLLENLLGWIRGQMEGLEGLRTRAHVRHVLTSVQQWLEPQAKAKNLEIVVEAPGNLTVLVDERMYETITRNLVSNAVKYSGSGATITLKGSSEDGAIVTAVIDQGVGIPPERLSHLFLAQRVDSKPGTAGERGTGLGLMFSADLARSLGGSLEASSVVGVGSTFRLLLPDVTDGEL